MRKLKAAIILDNLSLTSWQRSALLEASELLDVKVIINCKNTKNSKNKVRNFLYYVINIFTLRNKYTKRFEYYISNEKKVDFDCDYEGSWQSIPSEVSIHLSDIEVVIKFGMSLLKIDEKISKLPILSFHHGDPSKYRGRPAGFYELLYNEEKCGLIVQRLTNELDSGEVLAFAESKLVHYSYKKSAEQFYKSSKHLLRKALINLNDGRTIPIANNGKNYRLPNNSTVIKFFLVLLKRRVDHLFYGAFFEKKWKVGTVKFEPILNDNNLIDLYDVNELKIDPQYNFYADPFFSLDGSKIRLEALSNKSGLGDIIEIELSDAGQFQLLLTGKHYSFPFSFSFNGAEHLLPEVASHSSQYFFNLSNNKEKLHIKGLEGKRIVDATLLKSNDLWYLFFGEEKSAHSSLNLWVSNSIDEVFHKHPSSPVCISPSSARMAGRILSTDDGLFRFGQNNNRAYGSSITVSEITLLGSDVYEERECGSIKVSEGLGPHSIDFNKNKGIVLIDYYKDEFSLLAGVRRFKALLSKS